VNLVYDRSRFSESCEKSICMVQELLASRSQHDTSTNASEETQTKYLLE